MDSGSSGSTFSAMDSSMTQVRHSQFKDTGNGQKSSVATLFEQGTSYLSYALNKQHIIHVYMTHYFNSWIAKDFVIAGVRRCKCSNSCCESGRQPCS